MPPHSWPKLGLAGLALVLALLAAGCLAPAPEGDRMQVVTTIAPLADMVHNVGGDYVEVTVIVPPGAEPHTFEPTPSQMRIMESADLYVKNGAGLETWIELMVGDHISVVDSSKGVDLIFGEGGAERSAPDPHIWLSPRNGMIQVENIYKALADADPIHEEYYAQNRDSYLKTLQDLDSDLGKRLGRAHRRVFIVQHPAFSYLARDYGLVQVPLSVDEKEPGPRHMATVVDLVSSSNVSAIFVEPQFNPKSAQVIADETGCNVLEIDPLPENYTAGLRHAGEMIAESLEA
ncbi:MAG: zinc ABC transporter substrate-binding protein [Methanotrichaceae archaeon]|nr:zinc ABC transporter substrate-binding protein [Methanotrichaceae archaeon]